MKFLCIKCNEQMKYRENSGSPDGSMSITFVCPKCQNEVALLTNPGETQMVRALDVKIGGRTSPHQPMELLRGTLTQQRDEAFSTEESIPRSEDLSWTEEAEERLGRVPPFVRDMVRQGTETFARARGHNEITSQVLDEAKGEIGLHPDA